MFWWMGSDEQDSLEFFLGINNFLISEVFQALQDMLNAVLTMHLVISCTNVHRFVLTFLLSNNWPHGNIHILIVYSPIKDNAI